MITDMTQKQIYWTLVMMDNNEIVPGLRNSKNELLRESRLQKTTTVGTERDRWALHRNNALQLGNQIDRYIPREGKPTGCMLCEETKDSWAHRAECKTAIAWVKEWMAEIEGEEPLGCPRPKGIEAGGGGHDDYTAGTIFQDVARTVRHVEGV